MKRLILLFLPIIACTQLSATDRNWDGGTGGGGTSWTVTANWNPNGTPTTSDNLTLDSSIVSIPGSMTVSADIGAQTITFANNFNPSNTTVIGSGSATARTLTLGGSGTGVNPLITVSATSGKVTFQPQNGGSANLSLSLGVSGSLDVTSGGTLQIDCVIGQSSSGLGITKTGLGTLILGGASTYTGGTKLGTDAANTGGTLKLGANNALGSGGFTFAGGLLEANNKSFSIGALSLTANSTLNLGSDDGTRQDLTFASANTYGDGTLFITGWGGPDGSTYDRFIITADPSLSGILGHIQFDGYALGATWDSGTGEVVPVPEPINVALGVFGVVFVAFSFARRLRKGKAETLRAES